jgi:hypothetical protein
MECYATVTGMTATGVPATLHYENGTVFTERRGPDSLGYQPRDVAYPHHATGGQVAARTNGPTEVTSYWFTVAGSQLREVTEVDRRDAQGRLIGSTYRTRALRKHWAAVRQISIGLDRARLYVLTNDDELLRYRIRGKNGDARVTFDQVVGTGFGTIGTFEYVRTLTALGLRTDVFLATDADSGALLELAIPKDDPTTYTRTVLADTGWWDMRMAGRTASCVSGGGHLSGAIVGVGLDGVVRLWTDREPADGDGSDISEWGVLKAGWKPLAYSD